MRGGARWLVIGLLILLHFALHPFWAGWLWGPDLLAGGLLLGSLGMRASWAAALGFVLGILEASMVLGALGPTMLVLAAAGYGGAWLRDVFYSDSPRFVPGFLFIGVWIVQVALTFTGGGAATMTSLVVWAPLSAGLTALVCWFAERLVAYFIY